MIFEFLSVLLCWVKSLLGTEISSHLVKKERGVLFEAKQAQKRQKNMIVGGREKRNCDCDSLSSTKINLFLLNIFLTHISIPILLLCIFLVLVMSCGRSGKKMIAGRGLITSCFQRLANVGFMSAIQFSFGPSTTSSILSVKFESCRVPF